MYFPFVSPDHLPMRFSRSFQDLSIEEGRMECVAADNNVLAVSLSPTKGEGKNIRQKILDMFHKLLMSL